MATSTAKKATKKSTTKKTVTKAKPKATSRATTARVANAGKKATTTPTKATNATRAKQANTDAKPAKSTKDAKPTSPAKATTPAKASADRIKQDQGRDPVAKIAAKAHRMSGLDLAARVLADANEPLAARAIAERAIAAGWKTNGKTPHATLYAAMIREIAAKGKEARFTKKERGLFTFAPTSGKGA